MLWVTSVYAGGNFNWIFYDGSVARVVRRFQRVPRPLLKPINESRIEGAGFGRAGRYLQKSDRVELPFLSLVGDLLVSNVPGGAGGWVSVDSTRDIICIYVIIYLTACSNIMLNDREGSLTLLGGRGWQSPRKD